MTWVQPRVLDQAQVGVMKNKLEEWCQHVDKMQDVVSKKATDIMT